MPLRRDAIQVVDRLGATVEQHAAMLGHLAVPERELAGIAALVAQPAQQRVALGQHLLVLAQRAAIAGRDLAQGDVQIAAALRRRTVHQADVLRQEEHHPQPPHQVEAALRHAVDAHLFAHDRAAASTVPRQLQHQFQLLRVLPLTDLAGQPGVRQRALQRQPVDQLPLRSHRGDRPVASRWIASSRFVLPCALAPWNTITGRAGSAQAGHNCGSW